MRVLLLADVGLQDGLLHVGDEAMFEVAVGELRARGAQLDALSTTPDETRARYGLDACEARIDFSAARVPRLDDREDRLDRILRTAQGSTGLLTWDDPAWAVIQAVSHADAVLIAGGGNLNSQWPEHVYERAALGALAALFSKPLVVTGQTLGPELTGRDGELVSELLKSARLVGTREARSLRVASELGATRAALTLDDAVFLADPPTIPDSHAISGDYVLATFAPYSGSTPTEAFVARIAHFLDEVVDVTGLEVVLLPHQASVLPEETVGDAALHARIVEAGRSGRLRALPVAGPAVSAALARRAALSISTRYHPAVFALGGGVPSLTFSVDEYTDVKLGGNAANFGVADSAMSAVGLATDDARDTLRATWASRATISEHLARGDAARRAASETWWSAVFEALSGGTPPLPAAEPAEPLEWLDAELRARATSLREWVRAEGRDRVGAAIANRASIEERRRLEAALEEAEVQIGELSGELDAAEQRAVEAEAALAAAHHLMASISEPLFERTLRQISPPSVEAELIALRNTRTFRWSQGLRGVYARARGRRGRAQD